MHQFYRRYPDSAAAKGDKTETSLPADYAPKDVYDASTPSARVAKLARRLGRLVPGTYW